MAHPAPFIQVLMVTDIALLMRRNRGGRSRARHPQGQLPRVGEAPPVPRGGGSTGLPATVCLLGSGHQSPAGASPGALDTHHWGRRRFERPGNDMNDPIGGKDVPLQNGSSIDEPGLLGKQEG